MLKVIKEFPKYKISSDGIIYNLSGVEVLRQVNKDGYFVVNLYKSAVSGKSFHRRCARLVGQTFLEDSYFEGAVINHIDHNRTNDHVSNLEWVTTKYNNQISIDLYPEKHTRGSDYTEDQIREVCQMIQDGLRNNDILEKSSVTYDVINKVRYKQAWTWISKDYEMKKSRRGISENTVRWVCYQVLHGSTNKEILENSTCTKLSIDMIKKIRNKRTWKHITEDLLG